MIKKILTPFIIILSLNCFGQDTLTAVKIEECTFNKNKTALVNCISNDVTVDFIFDKDFKTVSYNMEGYDFVINLELKDDTKRYKSFEGVYYGNEEEYFTVIVDKESKQIKFLFKDKEEDIIVKFSINNWKI